MGGVLVLDSPVRPAETMPPALMSTIDAVYVLKDDTGFLNWELRYSLRSLERYVSGIRNLVFVTNTLPPFIDPEKVVHIEETDRENTKDQSIFRKVLTACQSDLV